MAQDYERGVQVMAAKRPSRSSLTCTRKANMANACGNISGVYYYLRAKKDRSRDGQQALKDARYAMKRLNCQRWLTRSLGGRPRQFVEIGGKKIYYGP